MASSSVAGVCVVLALARRPRRSGRRGSRVVRQSCRRCGCRMRRSPPRRQVAAGAFTPPTAPGRGVPPALARAMAALPAFCRVALTSKPTADSDIKIEVWLPASGWNGKFLAVGNGGWAGTISIRRWPQPSRSAMPTASTDTGHTTPGASFAVGHPEKLVDYAHRSLHEMAVQAKAVVERVLRRQGQSVDLEWLFDGRQPGADAGVDVPEDFDAIVAGAPPDIRSRVHAVRLVLHRFVHRTAGSYIPPEKYPAIHKAVMDACDAKDGVKDGIIENPPSCRFDPKVLQCKDADGPSCLTAEQVETARALYSDVKHPKTGEVLYSPLLQPGSELLWGTLAGPQPFSNASETYKYLVAKDAAWDPARFDPADRRGEDGHGGGRAEYRGPQPQAVFRARRQTSDVSRLERSAESGVHQRQLFQPRRERRRTERRRKVHSALHGSGHEPLPGRRRHRYVRQGRGHRRVDGEGHRAGADRRVACDRRKDRSHATLVPVPAGRRV